MQEPFGVRSLVADDDTDAGVDRDGLPAGVVEVDRLSEHLQDPLGDELGARVRAGRVEQDDELVAADPAGRVGLPDDARQSGADDLQELIARGVAEKVVDLLEAVDVDVQGGGRGLSSSRAGEHLLRAVEHQRPIREPGQAVVEGQVAEVVPGGEQIAAGEELAQEHENGSGGGGDHHAEAIE